MNNMQQFVEAGTLMLTGMVFVFAFLGLLIVFINTVLAKLAIKYPDPVVVASSRPNKKNKDKRTQNDEVSPAIVAAISGAIKRYRTQHGQD